MAQAGQAAEAADSSAAMPEAAEAQVAMELPAESKVGAAIEEVWAVDSALSSQPVHRWIANDDRVQSRPRFPRL